MLPIVPGVVDPVEPGVIEPDVEVPGVVVDGIGVIVLGELVDEELPIVELPIVESIDELELPIDPDVLLLVLPRRERRDLDVLFLLPFCMLCEFMLPLWPIVLWPIEPL